MAQRTPRVSIILPVWNAQSTLRDALNSIANQSERDFEIIAIDDESADDSLRILLEYANKDQRVTVISSGGARSAGGVRNIGLELASGKFISFVDSDDWIDSNFLSELVSGLEVTGAEIAVAGVKREYQSPTETQLRYIYEHANLLTNDFAVQVLSRSIGQDIAIGAAVTNKLFRKSFLDRHGLLFMENTINEDDVFTFISFVLSQKVILTPRVFYHIRQRPSSVSRSFSPQHIIDLYDAFFEIKQFLLQRQLYDRYKVDFFSFFEKCLSFVVETMQQNVVSKSTSERCVFLILSRMHLLGRPQEIISYIGHQRLLGFVRSF